MAGQPPAWLAYSGEKRVQAELHAMLKSTRRGTLALPATFYDLTTHGDQVRVPRPGKALCTNCGQASTGASPTRSHSAPRLVPAGVGVALEAPVGWGGVAHADAAALCMVGACAALHQLQYFTLVSCCPHAATLTMTWWEARP